jgi:hypothetical protein
MRIRPRTIRHQAVARLTAVLAVPLLAASLGACTSQNPTPDAAPSGQGGQTGQSVETDAQQWGLDYAACMREHGIDMEDPNADGGIVASRPEDETPAKQEATEACLEKLGPSPVGSGSSGSSGGPDAEEKREELLDLAACLREQGLDVEDPAPGEGLGMPGGITEEALETCDMDVTGGVPAQ